MKSSKTSQPVQDGPDSLTQQDKDTDSPSIYPIDSIPIQNYGRDDPYCAQVLEPVVVLRPRLEVFFLFALDLADLYDDQVDCQDKDCYSHYIPRRLIA